MKKLIALVMALAMVLSLGVAAFADTEFTEDDIDTLAGAGGTATASISKSITQGEIDALTPKPFSIVIPATMGEGQQLIRVQGNDLGSEKVIKVYLTSTTNDFKLIGPEGAEWQYAVTVCLNRQHYDGNYIKYTSNEELGNGAVVIETSNESQNGQIEWSVAGYAKPTVAGTYTDTLNFTVKVENA